MKKDNKHKNRIKRLNVRDVSALFASSTDTNGSYTGNPAIGNEPEQDADDL